MYMYVQYMYTYSTCTYTCATYTLQRKHWVQNACAVSLCSMTSRPRPDVRFPECGFYRLALYALSALDFPSREKWLGNFSWAEVGQEKLPLDSGKVTDRKTSWAVRTGLKMGKVPIVSVSFTKKSPVRTGLKTSIKTSKACTIMLTSC